MLFNGAWLQRESRERANPPNAIYSIAYWGNLSMGKGDNDYIIKYLDAKMFL